MAEKITIEIDDKASSGLKSLRGVVIDTTDAVDRLGDEAAQTDEQFDRGEIRQQAADVRQLGNAYDQSARQVRDFSAAQRKVSEQQRGGGMGIGLPMTELNAAIQLGQDFIQVIGSGARMIHEMADAGNEGLKPLAGSFDNLTSAGKNLLASMFATRGEMGLLGRATKSVSDLMADSADWFAGTTRQVRMQEAALRDLRDLDEKLARQRQLNAIGDMNDMARVNEEIKKRRELLEQQGGTLSDEDRTKALEEIAAFEQRHDEIVKEHQAYRKKAIEDQQQYEEEMEKKRLASLEIRVRQEVEAVNRQIALQRQLAQARDAFQLKVFTQGREEIIQRAENNKDFEVAHQLRMDSIRAEMNLAVKQAQAEMDRAKTNEERDRAAEQKQRAAIEGLGRLRDEEHQHRMQNIQREAQAEQERAQKEIEAARKAEQERRKLIEQSGAVEQIRQQFTQQQLFNQVVKQRQDDARQQFARENQDRIRQVKGLDPGLSDQERLRLQAQLQRELRQAQAQASRQAFFDAGRGRIGEDEIERARGQLTGQVINQAEQQKALSKANAQAFREATKAVQEAAQTALEARHIAEETSRIFKQIGMTTKNERQNIQRRGLGG